MRPKPKRTADGIVFASQAEKIRYQQLKLLERGGEIRNLELQPAYPCVVNGVLVCKVIWDFRYVERDGRLVIEDVKSAHTRTLPLYRLKRKLFEALYRLEVTEVLS